MSSYWKLPTPQHLFMCSFISWKQAVEKIIVLKSHWTIAQVLIKWSQLISTLNCNQKDVTKHIVEGSSLHPSIWTTGNFRIWAKCFLSLYNDLIIITWPRRSKEPTIHSHPHFSEENEFYFNISSMGMSNYKLANCAGLISQLVSHAIFKCFITTTFLQQYRHSISECINVARS